MTHSNPPRIAYAALRFFHERTGNIESLVNLMRGVSERGCQATLLVPHVSPEIEQFSGVAVHAYAKPARHEANIFAIERELTRTCVGMKDRFDLIQLQLPSPAFARVADRVRAATGLPVVASFESGYHRAPAVPWPRPGKTLLSLVMRRAINDRFHARWTRFAFDAAVVASEYQRAELAQVGCRAPVHVIANATVCERFERPPSSSDEGLPTQPGKKLIGYIGHFNFIKGVKYLVQAFEQLSRRRDDVHLVVVGSGRGNESDAVRRGVAALGARASLVERTVDVAALLHRLDVLALPYVASYGHQLYPNLVLEALAAGAPVVSSDIPPVNEIVREGKTGYLSRAGDPADLCEALERALRADRGALASAQRELCRTRFDYRVVAARHLQLYEGVLR
jgi:glycosyltransferase involved in cell wall biosynthesis